MKENIFAGQFWIQIGNRLLNWIIENGLSIIIIILIGFVAFRLLKFFTKRLKSLVIKRSSRKQDTSHSEVEKRANTLISILNSVLKAIIWLITIMILLSKFGVDIAPILASAGILGLAVGFGAQELVRDVISGFFILLEDQIRNGDVAIINGTAGLVEEIALRTIILRDLSGVVHVFQNGKINSLSNMTKEWSAIVLEIGVAYKEDIEAVSKIMEEVSETLIKDPEFGPKILDPIEIFGLDKFADSALVIKARIRTKPAEQWATGRAYRALLKKAFDAQNIEIPFPHTTLYWGEEIKPLDINLDKNLKEK
ncbi:MAG: mechanosensitive ion channel family protein [Bacteroidales bacterium]|jgi:small-conductance mechanosensitive channel|nr:mechanosensitive ion channel family protein [Bacteroidales bacterium]